jgi:hypothetical protein
MLDQGVLISEPDRGGIGCIFEQADGESGPIFVVSRLLKGGSALMSGVVGEGDALVQCNGQDIENMLDLRDLVYGAIGETVSCVFISRTDGMAREVDLKLQAEDFDNVSFATASDHAHVCAHRTAPAVSEGIDSLLQKLVHAEQVVMESDALYAGVQQNLLTSIQGDQLPFKQHLPMHCSSEDGRDWKHEYEMLSIVLSRYQDMADAFAASSESGEPQGFAEERKNLQQQLRDADHRATCLSDQLTIAHAQLSAKERESTELLAKLQKANHSRALSDEKCRELQNSLAAAQRLLDTSQSECKELVSDSIAHESRAHHEFKLFLSHLSS